MDYYINLYINSIDVGRKEQQLIHLENVLNEQTERLTSDIVEKHFKKATVGISIRFYNCRICFQKIFKIIKMIEF